MIAHPNAGRGRRVVASASPADVLDEDQPTRRDRDAVCANVIANALNERFGFVSLSVRYSLADAAIGAARAETEPLQRLLRQYEALSEDEQVRMAARMVQDGMQRDPGWLDPDPSEPDWEAGERP